MKKVLFRGKVVSSMMFSVLAAVWLMLFQPAYADAPDPKVVATNVYNNLKGNITQQQANDLTDKYFDTKSIAIQSLGLPYRNLSEQQKSDYAAAFNRFFKRNLFSVLTTYKNVTVGDLRSRVDGSRAVVRALVTPEGGQPIDLALNLSADGDAWKVNDVVVEGISLASGYRSQFGEIFKKQGFQGLMSKLN